jgi:signal transduction histidine kinase
MDPATLAITLILVLGCMAVLAFLVARGRNDRALSAWAWGLTGASVGFVGLLLQGTVPNPAVVLAGNFVLITYNFALPYGLRSFVGRTPAWPRRFTAYAAVWALVMVFFTLGVPSYPFRVTSTAVAMSALAVEFLVLAVRTPMPRALKILLTGVSGFYTLFLVYRGVFVHFSSGPSLLTDRLLTDPTFVISMVCGVLWAGGLILLDSERLRARIQADAVELARLNRLKDRVLALVGHDLRGPLGNLKMIWEQLGILVAEGRTSELDPALVGLVDRSLGGTQDLLENLLSFAQAQQSGGDPEARAYLPGAVSAAVDLWSAAYQHKTVALVNEGGDAPLVQADQDAVGAVLRNLLGNALKFTPAGGTVTVGVEDGLGGPGVWIKDTGIGMDPQTVFPLDGDDRRASRPGTDGERGSGFGLVLVRELVAGWGGRLDIDSAPGKGTRIRVGFPRSEGVV